jgi:hypothetical protein
MFTKLLVVGMRYGSTKSLVKARVDKGAASTPQPTCATKK